MTKMELSKATESEIRQVYQIYWDAYLRGDMETFGSFLDDDVVIYGTAVGEIFTTKKEALHFYTATAEEMTGKAEFRNRDIQIKPLGEAIAIFEQSQLYILIEGTWTFYGTARISGILVKKSSGWKIVHQHGSFPDSRTEEGQQIASEKIKEENLQLREAVYRRTIELENKTREIEIESALERVRTEAMGMRRPHDMISVCESIAHQLETFQVHHIRNVQVAVVSEVKQGYYLNYQYFLPYRQGVIEDVEINKHPSVRAMIHKMAASPEAYFPAAFKGKELDEWRKYRNEDNQFPDPILEASDAVYFHFYSIGQGGIGISSYQELNEDELKLFHRFRNVFTLAYQRFRDIEQAEMQAREARIESSLEKVRSIAMGMRKPEDLLNVCEQLYKECHSLGVSNIRNAIINIHNDEQRTFINYDFSPEIGKSTTPLTFDIHPVIEKQIRQVRSADDAFSETSFTGKELEEWKAFRKSKGEKDDPRIDQCSGLHYYLYSIGTGSIGISTFGSATQEDVDILKRFRNVFALAYQRYTEILFAESQAREAQIEAAMERVRARSMAMRTSDELSDVVKLLYQELDKLNANNTSTDIEIGLLDEETGIASVWAHLYQSDGAIATFNFPLSKITETKNEWLLYQKTPSDLRNTLFITSEFTGERLQNLFKSIVSFPELEPLFQPLIATGIEKWVTHNAYFSHGLLTLQGTEHYPQDILDIQKRFTKVF